VPAYQRPIGLIVGAGHAAVLPSGRAAHGQHRQVTCCLVSDRPSACSPPSPPPPHPTRPAQINKYVEREIINHMSLQHPHVVWLQEVLTGEQRLAAAAAEVMAARPPRPWRPRGRDLPFPRRR
jgi:hypothetical protein